MWDTLARGLACRLICATEEGMSELSITVEEWRSEMTRIEQEAWNNVGLTADELADLWGVSLHTVNKRLLKAKKMGWLTAVPVRKENRVGATYTVTAYRFNRPKKEKEDEGKT